MHFALPPRKTSRPPPYAAQRSSYSSYVKRVRPRSVAWLLGVIVFVIFILSRLGGGGPSGSAAEEDAEGPIPPGTPEVVLVTPLDPALEPAYRSMVVQNRELYAKRHGYATFLPNTTNYNLEDPLVPSTWSRIPATRHAMALYPHTPFLFTLDQRAFIMQPSLSLSAHLISSSAISSLQLPQKPVVPPDSVIRTFEHRDFDQVSLILSQDHQGLAQTSFVLRRGEWAKFFLDAWFDPLYRSYNFQRADGHALEHLVQWHVTVLARMVLVPQRIMNSYMVGANQEEIYQDGDFVANMLGCFPGDEGEGDLGRDCGAEAKPLFDTFMSRLEESKEAE